MGRYEKKGYLEVIRSRYKKANRGKKSLILEEFCATHGYNRKYAIRLLNKQPKRRKPKPRKGQPRYDKLLLMPVLKAIWLATGCMGSKKLKAALPDWLPHYQPEKGELSDSLQGQVYSLSAATIDRWLAPYRNDKESRRGLCGMKPGTLLKNHIPIKTDHWDVNRPGFLEADTVADCVNSLAGNFVWSITYTDIYSTWTEIRATWNKGGEGVKEQTQIVEQKNWTHVRQLFGYDRFGDTRLVAMMNDLYSNEWSLFQNHFCPSVKLIKKEKINLRYQKQYDKPATPYARLLESQRITDAVKVKLKAQHEQLNPFELKRIIMLKRKAILGLASVTFSMRQRI